MFKLLQENKDNKFKNLALIPGLNIDSVSTGNENIKLFRNVEKGRDVIDEKIFLKFFHLIDTKGEKNKNNTRKKRSNNDAKTKKSKQKNKQ